MTRERYPESSQGRGNRQVCASDALVGVEEEGFPGPFLGKERKPEMLLKELLTHWRSQG